MKNQYKIRTITCIGCNDTITKRMPQDREYCSLECYRKSKRPQRKTGILKNCGCCDKEIYVRLSELKENNFCSKKCADENQRQNKLKFECKICSKTFYWSKSRIKTNNPKYCSMDCRNQDKETLIKNALKGNLTQLNKKGLNRLELKGNEILNNLDIKYDTQVPMFNKFVVDVLLKDKKIVIQWDGEYWHTKEKRKKLDISQDAYLRKCGYEIIRITDKQIKNNIEEVYEIIKKTI